MKINLIEYIVKKTGLKQKDLAEKLQVSKAQISKWKAGESIPLDREDTLIQIAGLFGTDPDWAILSKTEENSQAWIDYILHMNDYQQDYMNSTSIKDEPDLQVPFILTKLNDLGVSIPSKAPKVVSETELSDDTYEYTKFDELINDYLRSYGPLDEWIQEFAYTDYYEIHDHESDLKFLMIDYAVCFTNEKLLVSNGVDPSRLRKFREGIESKVQKSILSMCNIMKKKKIPFSTNYFNILNKDLDFIEGDILMSDLRKRNNSIEDYFSLGERTLLSEIRKTNIMLEELHKKTDKLMGGNN